MSFLRVLLTIGFAISAFYTCKNSVKESVKPLEYFGNLQYDKVDTLNSDSNDFSLIFYFLKDIPNEKVYVGKDTIQHLFGTLGANGTFWMNEWITYTNEGKILDNESHYIYVDSNSDSTAFVLFGDDKLSFKIRIYEIQADSLTTNLIKEIEPVSKKIKVPSSEFVGNSIWLLYQREFIKDTILSISELEVFINRESKANSQRHLNLITDDRIQTIANTRYIQ